MRLQNRYSEEASPTEAINPIIELSRYALFDSVFLPLSPELLISRLGGCFVQKSKAANQCQAQLIRTLSLTGHPEKAEKLIASLSDQVDRTELKEYLALNEKLLQSY